MKKIDEVQYQRFVDMLKQLHINIPFIEAIEQMPKYEKFLKDMVTKKRSTATAESDHMHGSQAIARTIACTESLHCGDDRMRASINLMPLSIFKQLNVRQLAPTTVTLQLADISLVHLEGKVKDILVTIDKFILPADFIILDYEVDKDIDVYKEEITLSVNGQKIGFDIIRAMKYPEEEDLTEFDDELSLYEEEKSEDEDEGEDVTASIVTYNAITETSTKEENLTINEERKTPKPFLEQPSTVELKRLPNHLKYAFLGQNETLPVVISFALQEDQENVLLSILRKYIKAIVSKDGLEVDKAKIKAIEKLPPPANVKAVKSFLSTFCERLFKDCMTIECVAEGDREPVWDHLSRLENLEVDRNQSEVNATFPDEQLFKVEELPWTAYKTPIDMSPYAMVFEKACHLPLELEHKAMWAVKKLNFDLKVVGEARKLQLVELDE
ncbi:uncharacterized protein LOC120083118 [Benincasa hispida]|uniref:uncharacterized protein LOC120083118 n=1 Tax=Benincasa hispida TaxID=102211 RepID=UPI0019008D22|nr:uncharacterized protein LOC120083118 [Benincasa hispida]